MEGDPAGGPVVPEGEGPVCVGLVLEPFDYDGGVDDGYLRASRHLRISSVLSQPGFEGVLRASVSFAAFSTLSLSTWARRVSSSSILLTIASRMTSLQLTPGRRLILRRVSSSTLAETTSTMVDGSGDR